MLYPSELQPRTLQFSTAALPLGRARIPPTSKLKRGGLARAAQLVGVAPVNQSSCNHHPSNSQRRNRLCRAAPSPAFPGKTPFQHAHHRPERRFKCLSGAHSASRHIRWQSHHRAGILLGATGKVPGITRSAAIRYRDSGSGKSVGRAGILNFALCDTIHP